MVKKGKLKNFKIHLDSDQPVHYPGQTVSGHVEMTLKEPLKMKRIKLKMKGESACHWTEKHYVGDGEERHEETRDFKGKENIMKEVVFLFGDKDSDTEEHPNGEFTLPFSFTLPNDIPSSFESHMGHIRYVLKCTIEKPSKDHKTKRAFVVNDIIDTNAEKFANAPGGEKTKELGMLCCKSGPLELSTNIDRACYCPGEVILINANVNNKTNRNMDALNVKLIQTVSYKGKHDGEKKTNKTVRDVAKLKGPSTLKGGESTWDSQPLGIPALPPTITNSNIIKVAYKLKVIVDLPWGVDPLVKMHITIGTVPFLGMYGKPVQYGTPEDEQGPPANDISKHEALPAPPPDVFGYPEMLPPSYTSVVGELPVNFAKKKDTKTRGDLKYQPLYTFAQPYQGSYKPQNAPSPTSTIMVEEKPEE